MPPRKPTDAWDEILADLLPKSMRQWQDFQRKAVAYSALTLVTLAFGLYTRQGFQVQAPLVGFFGMEAAKNFRHWIEWRREHPTAARAIT